MKNLKKEILLFSRNSESSINGKTIQHAFQIEYHPYFIIMGFTDGSWGVIEKEREREKFDWDNLKSHLTIGEEPTKRTLDGLVAAGVLTELDRASLEEELVGATKKRLKDRFKNLCEEVVRTSKLLEEYD